MLFAKKGLGLELSRDGLSIVQVQGSGRGVKLERSQSAPLPEDTLRFSRREPNVANPQAFVAALKEAHGRLLTKRKEVSVSLPDSVGRVLLLDLDARFKSREEGTEIIRWKLKKSFPIDISSVHLDYQTLHESESGAVSLLVSLISRDVVRQYEDLFLEAGLEARFIDFTSFNLYRLFAQRLEMSDNLAFVTYYGGALSVLMFYGKVLSFYRNKELARESAGLYREVNSSFLVYKDKHPGRPVSEVFCLAAPDEAEAFRHLVAEACSVEPVLLAVERALGGNGGVNDRVALHALAAAMGAASRSA